MKTGLLDLPDDAVLAVATQLQQLQDRLQLLHTCRRLRGLGSGPSPLWRSVQFTCSKKRLTRLPREERFAAAVEIAKGFARWLSPRLAAVESVSFALLSSEPLHPSREAELLSEWPRMPALLLALPSEASTAAAAAATAAPAAAATAAAAAAATAATQSTAGGAEVLPLASLSIQWPGAVLLDFRGVPATLRLRRLCFPDGTELWIPPLDAMLPPPPLQHFELQDGSMHLVAQPAAGQQRGFAWLPPSLTSLRLEGAALRELPMGVGRLTNLRSLQLATNRLGHADLSELNGLETALQELNLSEAHLMRIPPRLSTLTNLRVLYLHHAFHRTAAREPGEWEALRPLRRLAFLSISGNRLAALPPAVANMSQLRGLHLEDSELAGGLPLAPYLLNLRELLLDWQAVLDSPAALRSAARLSRLVLSGHRVVDLRGPRGVAARAPAAAEPLLAALAAMPALRRVDDVFVGGEDVVTAAVARVMWEAGGRCPRLRVGLLLQDANVGMGLEEVERAEAAEAAAGGVAAAAAAGGATP